MDIQNYVYGFTKMREIKYDMRIIYAILGGKISHALNHKFNRNFRLYGLEMTSEKWMVLMCLWERDGLTQQELCNATLRDKPSMSRLIDCMEKENLVRRGNDENDLRTRRIWLTDYGKRLEDKSRFVADKTLKEALRGLSQEELNTCQETLRIIFNNSKG